MKRKKAALNALKRKVKEEKQKAITVALWELPSPTISIPPLTTITTNMAMDSGLRQQLEDKALGDAIEVWDFLHVFKYSLLILTLLLFVLTTESIVANSFASLRWNSFPSLTL